MSFCGGRGMQPHCTQCVHRHHHHQPRQFSVVDSNAQVPLSSSATVSADPAFTPLVVEPSPDVCVSSYSQSSSHPTYQYVCPLSLMSIADFLFTSLTFVVIKPSRRVK